MVKPSKASWWNQGGTKAHPCRKPKEAEGFWSNKRPEPWWNQGGTKEEPMPQHAENLRNHEVPSSDHARWQRGTKVEPGWSQGKTLQDTKESPRFLVQKASGTKWNQGGTKAEPRRNQGRSRQKTKEKLRFGGQNVPGAKVEPKWNQGGTKVEPRRNHAEPLGKLRISDSVAPQTWIYYNTN